ncbi:MAG: V-type ATP synthase subunit F [Dehalococcoidia bacterium]|nr:V-type ATP synthase subunit F [Dehalococcoidia bacterium]MDH5781525.1 V-type ATP synthase subunit F [Dehalococcoidia bacterium]
MITAKHLDIAAIGDEDMVSGLRLAGVSRYFMIKGNHDTGEDVRKALSELIDEPNIGVVVILEDYVEYVKDLVAHVRERRKVTPVIIEAPSKFGTKYKDIVGYYKTFIKASIGFEVEI